jgi:hypothetical protein
MKIPDRLQIFAKPVILTDKDAIRLERHLGGWGSSLALVLTGMQERDVERMIVIEMMGSKRPQILERLVGRYMKLTKVRIQKKVKEAIR